ncbi:ABC transporter substrate-binding protein [Paenibacillus lentus]|uniref:Helix-turn-helix domain-containing protein n=1 Tax=Paenibacillus lentus TaxID=1338368 RepID=A0A3S8RXS3_9BACL|nr:ABC transporter substrate-binding protein [Paenibacillus lentus]AZK47597.1 helix-turn-helix domain-containing protein [Paenibacillus lentus]
MLPIKIDHQSLYILAAELWYKLREITWIRSKGMDHQLVESPVLIVSKRGTGRLKLDMEDYRIRGDAVHFAGPGQTIAVEAENGQEIEVYLIRFDVLDDSGSKIDYPIIGELPVHYDVQTILLSELMFSCWEQDMPLERLRAQSAFQELIYRLLGNVRRLPESHSRAALERTKEFIDSHYHQKLNIDLLAGMAELSPKYYVDLFKKTYGLSAVDYITEVRMNHAKLLMLQSDTRLREIALQVGYSDEFYFSRKFKKEVGVAPSIYVKNRRRKIVAYTPSILGQLLALDMIPYAAPLHPKWTAYYYRKHRAAIPLHLSAYRFNRDWPANLEALRHVRPDVIICDDDHLQQEEREQLEVIAPVYTISWQDSWRAQFRRTAEFLNASQEADVWLNNYERKATRARERLSRELGEDTLLLISIHKQQCYVCPLRGMREVLYDDLRLNMLPRRDELHSYEQAISIEELAVLEADRILLNVCQEPESLGYWKNLQMSNLWRDLKAVRGNAVYMISSDPWREYSAYACLRMIDDLLFQLHGNRPNVIWK